MDEGKTSPRAGALFAVNMLVGTARGGTYSQGEYQGWLRLAGFAEVRRVPIAGPTDILIAWRT